MRCHSALSLHSSGLTFDSIRQSLKTHLFGDRSAWWLFWIYRRYINKSIYLSVYLSNEPGKLLRWQVSRRQHHKHRHGDYYYFLITPGSTDPRGPVYHWPQVGCIMSLSLYVCCRQRPLYQNQIFKIAVTFNSARCHGSVFLWRHCNTSCTSQAGCFFY